jgi:flagellar motility protein MotE (MotC chaperone)
MKKLLVPSLIALLMFGISGAASWKWRQAKSGATESGNHDEPSAASVESAEGERQDSPTDESKSPRNSKESMSQFETKSAASEDSLPRVAVRPAYTPGIEETVQLASSLRDRAATVRERETQLVARQKQLELVYEDIRSERAAMDELRKQIGDELKAAEEQMTEVEHQRAELELKQQTMEGRVTEMDGREKDNIKRMGGVYDNMAPESAAKILQQMADSGTMDTAVKLLAVMKERQAAKVLAEMADPSLAAQLSERLKGLKRPTAQPKK